MDILSTIDKCYFLTKWEALGRKLERLLRSRDDGPLNTREVSVRV